MYSVGFDEASSELKRGNASIAPPCMSSGTETYILYVFKTLKTATLRSSSPQHSTALRTLNKSLCLCATVRVRDRLDARYLVLVEGPLDTENKI